MSWRQAKKGQHKREKSNKKAPTPTIYFDFPGGKVISSALLRTQIQVQAYAVATILYDLITNRTFPYSL